MSGLALLAFEDPVERSAIAGLLSGLGFEVRQVSTGRMALCLLRYGRPVDIALVESMETAIRARNEGLGTPFVVISPCAREPVSAAGLSRLRFVQRPVDEAGLGAVVTEVLGSR